MPRIPTISVVRDSKKKNTLSLWSIHVDLEKEFGTTWKALSRIREGVCVCVVCCACRISVEECVSES